MSKEANKDAKKSQVEEVNPEVIEDEEADSPWYYFYSQGCGWCKKSEPIVDELNEGREENQEINLYSDGTLTVLNNLNIPKFHVKFEGLFPYSLSSLQFDATQTDLDYFTAQVSFKYNIYNIETI